MNPRGYVLVIAGIWVICQVFGGNALQRLKIIPEESAAPAPPVVPPGPPGVPPGPGSVPTIPPGGLGGPAGLGGGLGGLGGT